MTGSYISHGLVQTRLRSVRSEHPIFGYSPFSDAPKSCVYIYISLYIYICICTLYICTVSYIPTISPFFLLKSSIFHGKSTIGRFSLEFPYFPGWFHQLIILRPGRRLSSEESFNSLVEHFGRGPKCLGVEEGWRFIRLIWYILGYNWVVPIYADIY